MRKITRKSLAKSNWRFYTFSIFWAGLILLLSLWSGSDIPSVKSFDLAPDKIVHFALFFVFTFSLFISLKKNAYRNRFNNCNNWAFGLAVSLAFITEGLQLVTGNRMADPSDLFSDILGIIIAGLVLRVILGKQIFFKFT